MEAYHNDVRDLRIQIDRLENQGAALRAELLQEIDRKSLDTRKDIVSGMREMLEHWEKGKDQFEDRGAPRVVRKILLEVLRRYGLYLAVGIGFVIGSPDARRIVFGWVSGG